MEVYICDSCGSILKDPHDVRMKEFGYCADSDSDLFISRLCLSPFKQTKKIHLCGHCYDNLKNLVKEKQNE